MWLAGLCIIIVSTLIYLYGLLLEYRNRKRQRAIFPLVFHNGLLMNYGPNNDYTVDSNGIVQFLFRENRNNSGAVVQIIYGDGRRSSDPSLYQYPPPPPLRRAPEPVDPPVTVTRIPLGPLRAAPRPTYSRWVETPVERFDNQTPRPDPEVPAEERYNRDLDIGE